MNDLLGLNVSENLLWYQMVSRAIVVFIAALIFIRVAGMRSFGTHSAFDIVLNITLGAMLSRCIAGHYPFFPTLLTTAVLALLHRLTAYLVWKFAWLRKVIEGEATVIFSSGRKKEKTLSKFSISEDDLTRALHENNIDTLSEIKTIWYETDGKINVVKNK